MAQWFSFLSAILRTRTRLASQLFHCHTILMTKEPLASGMQPSDHAETRAHYRTKENMRRKLTLGCSPMAVQFNSMGQLTRELQRTVTLPNIEPNCRNSVCFLHTLAIIYSA